MPLSPRRRIALNIIATYGRSLLSLACGLFTCRWVLSALGVEAYGVYSVTAVITTMMTLLNSLLAASVGRFFAVSVGRAQKFSDCNAGVEECCRWFNVALVIHTLVPTVLLVVGCPIATWALKNYFVIPVQYQDTASWVMWFAIATAYMSMITVPFRAMYTAKQEIAELTIYSVCQTIVNFFCAYALLFYPGDKLFFHATYGFVIANLPTLVMVWRARRIFPECKVSLPYMRGWDKYFQIVSYTGWLGAGSISMAIQTQLLPTFVNRYVGIRYNSTIGIASTVVMHTGTLSSAFYGAFSPAIQNAGGAGDRDRAIDLSLKSCKFGGVLGALFALPMMLEADYVIGLWLENPPPLVVPMCLLLFVKVLVEKLAGGMLPAIHGYGKIAIHEVSNGLALFISLAFGWYFITQAKLGVVSFAYAHIIATALIVVSRVLIWKFQLRYPLREWTFRFFIPYTTMIVAGFFLGRAVQNYFEQSFIRLVLIGGMEFVLVVVLSVAIIFNEQERAELLRAIKKITGRANEV